MLQAALNGDRDHPALPRTADELAAEGRAAVEAGALVLHLHPYDGAGGRRWTRSPAPPPFGPCAPPAPERRSH